MDRSGFGSWLKGHCPPDDHTTSGSVGSTTRIRLGTLVAAIFAFVLVSLAIALVGGFGAQSASAQSATQTGVWSWGFNLYGQLGDGSTTNRNAPVQVSGLSGATDMAAGIYHSLALKSDGTVWSWGWNRESQLGDGTTTDVKSPCM